MVDWLKAIRLEMDTYIYIVHNMDTWCYIMFHWLVGIWNRNDATLQHKYKMCNCNYPTILLSSILCQVVHRYHFFLFHFVVLCFVSIFRMLITDASIETSIHSSSCYQYYSLGKIRILYPFLMLLYFFFVSSILLQHTLQHCRHKVLFVLDKQTIINFLLLLRRVVFFENSWEMEFKI